VKSDTYDPRPYRRTEMGRPLSGNSISKEGCLLPPRRRRTTSTETLEHGALKEILPVVSQHFIFSLYFHVCLFQAMLLFFNNFKSISIKTRNSLNCTRVYRETQGREKTLGKQGKDEPDFTLVKGYPSPSSTKTLFFQTKSSRKG
jgi:hypothetical protein